MSSGLVAWGPGHRKIRREAKELTKYYGCGMGYIRRVAEGLSGNDGNLNAETDSGTHNGLVSEILSCRGIHVEAMNEYGSDKGEDPANGKKGLAVPC